MREGLSSRALKGGGSYFPVELTSPGYLGAPFSNPRIQSAAAPRVQSSRGRGDHRAWVRQSGATILLNHVGKDLRNLGAPPPQEYPYPGALHPRRL